MKYKVTSGFHTNPRKRRVLKFRRDRNMASPHVSNTWSVTAQWGTRVFEFIIYTPKEGK